MKKSIKMLGNVKPEAETVIEGLSKSLTKKVMHNFLLSLKSIPASPDEVERLVTLFTSNGNERTKSKEEARKSEKIS